MDKHLIYIEEPVKTRISHIGALRSNSYLQFLIPTSCHSIFLAATGVSHVAGFLPPFWEDVAEFLPLRFDEALSQLLRRLWIF